MHLCDAMACVHLCSAVAMDTFSMCIRCNSSCPFVTRENKNVYIGRRVALLSVSDVLPVDELESLG